MAGRAIAMKLISKRYPSPEERRHSYSPAEAKALVRAALRPGKTIDGLDKLRREQRVLSDNDVLRKVETGQWLLVKHEAYVFDWGHFEQPFQRKLAEQEPPNTKAFFPPRLPPSVLYGYEFRVVDKAGKRLAFRKYIARVNGQRTHGVTDADGKAVIKTDSVGVNVSVHVLFESPVGEILEFAGDIND